MTTLTRKRPSFSFLISVTLLFVTNVPGRVGGFCSALLQNSQSSCHRRKGVGLLPSRRRRSISSSKIHQDDQVHQEGFVDQIQVFDGVFEPTVCIDLHYLAVEHADRSGEGSSVFSWNPTQPMNNQETDLTPLEQALGSVIEQLYYYCCERPGETVSSSTTVPDTTSDGWVVEYWSREEFINMDAHSDIDERQLLDEGTLRCPHYGHVLYLDVHPSVRGPTCVFSQMGGWRSKAITKSTEVDDREDLNNTSLVTVPAVSGRVLKFPGSAMHAVPKPATLWFQSRDEQQEILENDEDNIDNCDDSIKRSVILFNIWSKKGPRGVVRDYISKGDMPEGVALVTDDDDKEDTLDAEEHGSSDDAGERAERMSEWEKEYGVGFSDLCCEPRSDWKEVSINSSVKYEQLVSDKGLVTVPLMGKQARRLYPTKHVTLSAPENLYRALEDGQKPHHFILYENASLAEK